jgi:hypothetical protein
MLALELQRVGQGRIPETSGTRTMRMEKLFLGVLRILTPIGPRYVRPPMLQRLYLLWIFRHFQVLPLQVLSSRQQRFIDALCSQRRFVSIPQGEGLDDAPVLGTVEWRPRLDANDLPPKRPSTGVASVAGLVEGVRQRS